ncbi:hypothetical protein BD324DRAFT_613829 [Kockovaella imperatae]|uniref:Uncharacterized protein n=1 Tax=Kockovaella imperatae TaxID=4999 RepID=A0A1Y1UTG9_9TREE|nr:hypothetical protein BD324DRAFT_613829 [Kockovaella imperatae]ORX41252.1 hypothetical protein BD324DRAFT_613829 [Kockovaella imperatae]
MSLAVRAMALLASATAALAWYPCYDAPLTLAQLIGEPCCPDNLTAFHSFVQVHIANHSAYDVWRIVGNFEDLSWQGTTNITTTGIKNAPNNTHTQITPAGPATEELNIYVGPAYDPPSPTQSLFFMQFKDITLSALLDVYFIHLEDLLISRKDGNGSILSWESSGCTNTTSGATKLFNALHSHNLNNTVNILNGGTATSPV